jgi:hypothetical protein
MTKENKGSDFLPQLGSFTADQAWLNEIACSEAAKTIDNSDIETSLNDLQEKKDLNCRILD